MKGKAAISIARTYRGKTKNFTGQNFLARGYFVSTVGRDEQQIREYIRNQEKEDNRLDQLNLFKEPELPAESGLTALGGSRYSNPPALPEGTEVSPPAKLSAPGVITDPSAVTLATREITILERQRNSRLLLAHEFELGFRYGAFAKVPNRLPVGLD